MADVMEPFVDNELDVTISAVRHEETLARHLDDTLYELRYERYPWEELWREIFAYVLPEREFLLHWFEQNMGTSNRDGAKGYIKRIGLNIHDSTAPNALQLLAAGIQGYVVSEQERWFRFVFPYPEMMEIPGVRVWVQEVENLMYEALARSNFYSQLSPLILDAASCGTATQFFNYDDKSGKAVFSTQFPVQIFIQENARGEVDTVYRIFRLTRRQAIQQFGEERLSRFVLDSKSATESFQFLHAVFPRGDKDHSIGLHDRAEGSILDTDAPWISVYKEIDAGPLNNSTPGSFGTDDGVTRGAEMDKVISVGGYWEFPYAVWRWDTDPLSVYGLSPSRRMLPQIRQLNFMGELLKSGAQLAVRPPWMIPSQLQGRARLTPHAFNYVSDPKAKIEPILNAVGHYPIGQDREADLRQQLNEAFGVDYFLLMARITAQGQSKTATEVLELQSEKAAVLASVKRRMGSDFLEKVIDWLFRQENKRGRLPTPPRALVEAARRKGATSLKIDYIGPLAQAQRRHGLVHGRLQILQAIAQYFPMKPEMMDAIKWTELTRAVLLEGGFGADMVHSVAEIEQLREIAMKRAAKQQALEDTESMSRSHRNMESGAGGAAGAEAQPATVLPAPPAR